MLAAGVPDLASLASIAALWEAWGPAQSAAAAAGGAVAAAAHQQELQGRAAQLLSSSTLVRGEPLCRALGARPMLSCFAACGAAVLYVRLERGCCLAPCRGAVPLCCARMGHGQEHMSWTCAQGSCVLCIWVRRV